MAGDGWTETGATGAGDGTTDGALTDAAGDCTTERATDLVEPGGAVGLLAMLAAGLFAPAANDARPGE